MKSNLFTVLTIITLAFVLMTATPAHSIQFHGAGGFSISFYNPNVDFLKERLAEVSPGFNLSDNPVLSWGGFGYATISDNIRIGGFGFGGVKTSTSSFYSASADRRVPQDVVFEFGGGGFLFEYILPQPHRRVEGTLGFGIGGSSYSIRISQYGPNTSWDEMTEGLADSNSRDTFQMSFVNGGLMLNPGIGIKYYVLRWFAIEANASYVYNILGDWKFNSTAVRDMPDADFSAPMYGVRFIFGG